MSDKNFNFFEKNLDNIDEKYHELYKLVDGGYQLKAAGVVSAAELKKQKEELLAAQKKIEEEKSKTQNELEEYKHKLEEFGDYSPEEYAELKKKLQEAEERKLKENNDFDGAVERKVREQTTQMKKTADEQIKHWKEQAERNEEAHKKFEGLYRQTRRTSLLQDAISKYSNPKVAAIQDIMNRATEYGWEFDPESEDLKAFGSSGSERFGSDGKSPLSIQEWITDLMRNSDHLFESSQGGGATGNANVPKKTGGTVIDSRDFVGFSENLEDIAAGRKTVS